MAKPPKTTVAAKAAPARTAPPAAAKTAPAKAAKAVETPAETPAAPVQGRGPRGVLETAVITLLQAENPKRAGTKAFDKYSHYKDGMTVAEFLDAVPEGTSTLVYDAAHGFISIEGYDPAVKFEPKPKKEKAAKEPKAPKAGGKSKKASEPAHDPDANLDVDEEKID